MATTQHKSAKTSPTPRIPMNDLVRSFAAYGEDLTRVVSEVVQSGWYLNGPETRGWEADLSAFVGATRAIAVGNGTDALELSIRAAMHGSDKTAVLTAANCGGYTSIAARRAGFDVRFADVDRESHLLTDATIRDALDDSVGVVVVTHLYGRAAELDAMLETCRVRGIAVVEDCAEAIGARDSRGRPVGSIGDVGAFSFYPTKNLGALGDSGAVVTSRDDIADHVRQLHQYGWASKYDIAVEGGRNSRTDEIQAAILRFKLKYLDDWNATRRAIVERYRSSAAKSINVLPAGGPWHVGHLAVATTPFRSELREHLEALDIATDVHFPIPDHQQSALRADYEDVQLPTTEGLAAEIVSLPVFPELSEEEIARICAALSSFAPRG